MTQSKVHLSAASSQVEAGVCVCAQKECLPSHRHGETRGKGCNAHRGHRMNLLAEVSFALVEMNQECETLLLFPGSRKENVRNDLSVLLFMCFRGFIE